jgi:hypothetical protein
MPPSTTTEELCRLIWSRRLRSRLQSGNRRKMGAKVTGDAGPGPHAGAQRSTVRMGDCAYTGFFRSK